MAKMKIDPADRPKVKVECLRVNGLKLERVEALAEDLLDFTSLGNLERWLDS